MLTSLIIFAQASALTAGQAAAPAVPAAPVAAARTLQGLPNTTIEYYDVTGKDAKSIRESMALAHAALPGGEKGSPATATWNLGANISRSTTDGKCAIAGANLKFDGKILLPRLTNMEQVPAPMQAAWRNYVTKLEASSASTLWFVHDHIGTIQKAILASSCEGANAAATAALEQLRTQEAEFRAKAAAAQAAIDAAAAAAAAAPAKK